MKTFSNKWKSSRQRRKQHKYRIKAPLHIRHEMISSSFSKELRKKYKRRNFPVRKGDTVLIVKGEFKKKKGKIARVDTHNLKIYIEGIQQSRKDGTKVDIPIQPANVRIVELDLNDKIRAKIIGEKK